MINKKLVDWLQDICRAVFVVQNAPKTEPLADYAKLTIQAGLAAVKAVRGEIDRVEAAFQALLKAN